MTEQLWIALASAVGVSGLLSTLVTYLLRRRDARMERREGVNTASIQDQAAYRGELWQQLQVALQRNDALAQQRGQLYQEKAEAQAERDAVRRQVDDLIQRLSAEGVRANNAEHLREQDRIRFERRLDDAQQDIDERDAKIEHLSSRVVELEQDLALALRGQLSRRSDRRRESEGKGDAENVDRRAASQNDRGAASRSSGRGAPDRIGEAADRPEGPGAGASPHGEAEGVDRSDG